MYMLNNVSNLCNTIGESIYGGINMDKTALALSIIGSLNWALVGIFRFDIVAWIFGGQTAGISRVIYTIIGLAGIWCISLLFRDWHEDTYEGAR